MSRSYIDVIRSAALCRNFANLPASSQPPPSAADERRRILDPMRTTARDQGLRRVSSLTRWVAAAGVGVVGVFSGMVAKVYPGNSSTHAAAAATGSTSAASTSGSGTSATTASTSAGSTGLQTVKAPTTTTTTTASVVSGAS
jgi:hypothetical protein